MRFNSVSILYPALFSMFLAGCATVKTDRQVYVSPVRTLTPDSTSSVQVDVTVHVPEKAFSKRSRLIVVPQLMQHDRMLAELTPMVLDAPIFLKKMTRRKELEDYRDPYAPWAQGVEHNRAYDLVYRERVFVPDSVSAGQIVAVLSADGCGSCGVVDTIDVAYISNLPNLIEPKKSLQLNWIEPEFVIRPKVMKGRGEALLQFVINRYDINLSLGRNREEMNRMLGTLQTIVNDSLATLNSVSIYGMASADGAFTFNTTLSRNRANSARKWLESQLNINLEDNIRFSIGSRPEGWLPVLEAMRADRHPDTLQVKNILDKYNAENDDVAERYIRRLACWPDIRAKYLQKDRKVEYEYTYTIKSFTTDEELLLVYATRPDAFNEEELLRVSTLKQTAEEKKEVYQTILHYFPESQVAANNLAVLYLREDNPDAAEAILDRLKSYSPELLNTRAAVYVYRNEQEKAIELLREETELPEARYNLALLKARMRQLDEAYALIRGYKDVNAAVIALSVGQNDEADRMMEQCEEVSPLAEYIRALISARKENKTGLWQHLRPAVVEPKFRLRAVTEPDFRPYRMEEEFQELTNGGGEHE